MVPSSSDDHSLLQQYELAGLVWFQGWNDVIDDVKVAEYGSNLANFIRDMRLDLETSNLGRIGGTVQQAGPVIADGLPALRRQMRKVTQQVKFIGNTRYIMTSPYVVRSDEGAEHFNGDYHFTIWTSRYYILSILDVPLELLP